MKVITSSQDATAVTQFVIACPANDEGMAASAMYYLPINYSLVVGTDGWRDKLGVLADDRAIMDRVQVTNEMETPEAASPFHFARIVLGENAAPEGTPEAYASAILDASRVTA